MVLKVYNTKTRKKEVFKPLKKGQVSIYSCGPTVYDYAHIGNFRAYVAGDLLKRYLEYKGYKVKHVMNLTDVDDKTIKGAKKQKMSLNKYTEKYVKAFFEDFDALNLEKPTFVLKATEHIKEMVALIKTLLKKGYAYKAKDGSIYYDVSKFKNYGKLAQIKLGNLKSISRISADEYSKEQAQDFALWKAWRPRDGDVFWKTNIGKGRPGWHIECSAMSMAKLGKTFDIHTGGIDLVFPHHQNELAQSEAATGKQFVKYWIHNEWLLVEGKKMSKSAGNFYTIRDLLAKGYDPVAIRYVLLATHYKTQLNFTFKDLDAAKIVLDKLRDFIFRLEEFSGKKSNKKIMSLVKKAKNSFEKYMDDNLNISPALAAIFEFVKEINKLMLKNKMSTKDARLIYKTMQGFDKVLGLKLVEKKKTLSKVIKDLIKNREEARKKKDWKTSDKIRAELRKKGIVLEDLESGTRWRFA